MRKIVRCTVQIRKLLNKSSVYQCAGPNGHLEGEIQQHRPTSTYPNSGLCRNNGVNNDVRVILAQ